ncbi:ABC transporter permease [Nonomuraea sp. MG754425]|uniref:ABC transporter permease n=1 Tax=Nonomuraea sp. MG754425 TaxID=2570319 RepID=UPI001F160FD0|nr:ABC transporter permease [Nonomuraea sp. MG754425]MCF6471043.1 ABC transporter permease [Nonomuraea sp. MG754425]
MIDILRSEWTKIRSVRSTVWTLVVTAFLMVGLAVAFGFAAKGSAGGEPVPGDAATMMSMAGVMVASLSMAALGVLVISSEYRTGGIRTSLMAVPKRMSLLTGKIAVFTATALVTSLLAASAAMLAGLLITQPPSLDMGDVLRSVLGASLYLTACGLFGLGLGTLIRHTPGAMVSVIALITVLPPITVQLPGQWGRTVSEFFTTNAGMLIVIPPRGDSTLGPWSGFGVYLVWIAVPLIVGAVAMRRRDA